MKVPISQIRNYSGVTILALLPLAALFGNAPADIALVLTVIVFLGTSESIFQTLKQSRFMQLSAVFWLWILLCSAVSLFPKHSFQDSLPWIRFPLYAFALSIWLSARYQSHRNAFLTSAVIGSIIQFSVMGYQFVSRRMAEDLIVGAAARLTGTFEKQMAGWYIIGISLIIVLEILQMIRENKLIEKQRIIGLFFVGLTSIFMLMSGEMINTIAFLGTIFFFFVFRKVNNIKNIIPSLITVSLILILVVLFAWLDQGLHDRFTTAINYRLPWLPTSDYYPPLRAGYEFASQHLLFGVGPKNTFNYCQALKEQGFIDTLKLFNVDGCPWHPHNLYLQIAAETGLVGLALFSSIVVYLLITAITAFKKASGNNNIAIAILFVSLFPLQTYSQAFGQSRNFYLWTLIGFALSTVRTISERDNSAHPNSKNTGKYKNHVVNA